MRFGGIDDGFFLFICLVVGGGGGSRIVYLMNRGCFWIAAVSKNGGKCMGWYGMVMGLG